MTAYMPTSASEEWGTPRSVFSPLNSEFGFTVDVAARPWNTKHPNFWTPNVNGLAQDWGREPVRWCNPPYGARNIEQWLAKGTATQDSGITVYLLPNTTDVQWFHQYVWDMSRNRTRPGIELRFFKGRIKFDVPPDMFVANNNGNVKGNILVVMRPIKLMVQCPTCGRS